MKNIRTINLEGVSPTARSLEGEPMSGSHFGIPKQLKYHEQKIKSFIKTKNFSTENTSRQSYQKKQKSTTAYIIQERINKGLIEMLNMKQFSKFQEQKQVRIETPPEPKNPFQRDYYQHLRWRQISKENITSSRYHNLPPISGEPTTQQKITPRDLTSTQKGSNKSHSTMNPQSNNLGKQQNQTSQTFRPIKQKADIEVSQTILNIYSNFINKKLGIQQRSSRNEATVEQFHNKLPPSIETQSIIKLENKKRLSVGTTVTTNPSMLKKLNNFKDPSKMSKSCLKPLKIIDSSMFFQTIYKKSPSNMMIQDEGEKSVSVRNVFKKTLNTRHHSFFATNSNVSSSFFDTQQTSRNLAKSKRLSVTSQDKKVTQISENTQQLKLKIKDIISDRIEFASINRFQGDDSKAMKNVNFEEGIFQTSPSQIIQVASNSQFKKLNSLISQLYNAEELDLRKVKATNKQTQLKERLGKIEHSDKYKMMTEDKEAKQSKASDMKPRDVKFYADYVNKVMFKTQDTFMAQKHEAFLRNRSKLQADKIIFEEEVKQVIKIKFLRTKGILPPEPQVDSALNLRKQSEHELIEFARQIQLSA